MSSQPRNLRKEEVRLVISGFTSILDNIVINSKKLITSSNNRGVVTNPEITVEEIQDVFQINESSKLDFIRQLYIRSGDKLLKKLFPDENILNLPIISFEENGLHISMKY